ncbi:MAG: hypothetical protein R3E66_24070 [bacterium]
MPTHVLAAASSPRYLTPGSEAKTTLRAPPGDPNAYDVLSLEEFHAPDRTRLVLTLESDQPQLDHDLRVIAVALQGQSHANVVLVERLTTGGKKRAHLFAPDGLGWSGAASPIHIES